MKRNHAHLSLLPQLHTPIQQVMLRTGRLHPPSALPTIETRGVPMLYVIALALILLWLGVLTWMVQRLHG
jgi:hypothetical protein